MFGVDLKNLVKRPTDELWLYECNFIT